MTLEWRGRHREVEFLDVLGILGALGLLVARFVPVARLPFWGCALRQTTGWPCPACGLTRVAEHVSRGELKAAWMTNPLGSVAALIFAILAVAGAVHLLFAIPLPRVQATAAEARCFRVFALSLLVVNYAYVVVSNRFPQWLGAL